MRPLKKSAIAPPIGAREARRNVVSDPALYAAWFGARVMVTPCAHDDCCAAEISSRPESRRDYKRRLHPGMEGTVISERSYRRRRELE